MVGFVSERSLTMARMISDHPGFVLILARWWLGLRHDGGIILRIPYTVYRIPYTVYRIPYTIYLLLPLYSDLPLDSLRHRLSAP